MKLEFRFSRLCKYGVISVIALPCMMCKHLTRDYVCKRVSPSLQMTKSQSSAGVCPDVELNNRGYRKLI